jgi:hypothetical protein
MFRPQDWNNSAEGRAEQQHLKELDFYEKYPNSPPPEWIHAVEGVQTDDGLWFMIVSFGVSRAIPSGKFFERPCPKVHGNSLEASGPHDVYVIRDARTGRIYHFGETGRGFDVRGGYWIAKLKKEYKLDTVVEHLKTVEGKQAAKELESKYIQTYERIYGFKPGFEDANGNFVPIQKSAH